MRKRLAAAVAGVVLGAHGAGAQPPQFPQSPFQPLAPVAPAFPGSPSQPKPPQPLPPGVVAPKPATPGPAEVALPHAEIKLALHAQDVAVKRVAGGWEVWAGARPLRATGNNNDSETNARDVVRVFRDLRPTEWVTIGATKPVVEYGLTNGRPAVAAATPDPKTDPKGTGVTPAGGGFGPAIAGGAKVVQPIDLKTARVEAIRGTWTVRDDNNILFNFGLDKAGAEQTAAVIHKYGFNRVGVVGAPQQPVMSYLYVSTDAPPRALPGAVNAQIDSLTRTGIPIPGVGYTGEMVKIDPRKVEARKDGFEWVVAAGPEVLGRFGPTEWAAREAARTVQDAKYTEFCKLGGTANLTFFLRDGKAPTRAPISAQGRTFDLTTLKVQPVNGKWAVTEGGRQLFEVGSASEGETVVRVLKAYGFDQLAHLTAGGPKGGVMFMVKNR
ncbi:MAG: hypothetical protein FJ304_12745 [Planctomycetes bacterium]|nr:hypothetical protein [Planctomycetota bacterium]